MSLVKEILERLSGVHVVSEKLDMTMDRVKALSEHMLDHEKRLVRIETRLEGQSGSTRPRTIE